MSYILDPLIRRSAWALKCISTEMHCPSHILSRRSAWLSWSRRSPRVRGHGGPVGGLGDGGYRRSGAKIRGVIWYKVDFDFVRAPVPGVGVRRAGGGLKRSINHAVQRAHWASAMGAGRP
jgi:hypothetical protein